MMKYTSLLFIFGLISLCFREIINMNSSIQNQFKICKKLKEEVPALNLNCRELLRKQMEESNSIENISLNENLQLLKNKRTDISLLELTQENAPLNKIFNTKKEKERDKTEPIGDIKSPKHRNSNAEEINHDFNPVNTEQINNNPNTKNYDEDAVNNESYDENLHNLHRIEKIENLINVINGNVNFISLELKSIKNSLMKKRKPNYIKQKPSNINRINQEDPVDNMDKEHVMTSEAVLREIEKLKNGHKNNLNAKNKSAEAEEINENNESENKKSNSKFKKAGQDKGAFLQIKSFNDLNIDLDSLEKNQNAEIHKEKSHVNNNNNKDDKQMQDLNNIIEGFRKKQASEESSLNKKKFHKQVTLNDKQEKLESNVNHIMELLNQLKVDNEDVFSQVKSKIASVEKANNNDKTYK